MQIKYKAIVTHAQETATQLTELLKLLFCHSGPDPESVRLQAGAVMQVQVLHREMPAPGSRR
jgi:hypothetical protein